MRKTDKGDEVVGVKLHGGPFDGHSNAYDSGPFGGWPMPEKIVAFKPPQNPEVVAICTVDRFDDASMIAVTGCFIYSKEAESKLTEDEVMGTDLIIRGAEYRL